MGALYMYNEERCQAKSVAVWKNLLADAERMLAEAKTKEERKELRKSVRAFEFLIRQKALVPGIKKPPIKGAGKAGKAA